MSQTSSSLTESAPINRISTIHSDIKPLFTNINVNDCTTIKDFELGLDLISRPKMEHQRLSRNRLLEMSFRAKAVAIASAVITLPVLANRTSAYDANQSITAQSTQAEQVRANEPATIELSPGQLPLTLVVETLVAALLLVGLIAAYFANRAMRPVLTATAKDEKLGKVEPDSSAQILTPVSFALNQASFPEQQEDVAERTQLLQEITLRIRQSLYLEDLLKTSVKEVRRAIKTDRVIIYGLDPTNWDGSVVAESVAPGWPQTLKVKIDDPCFRDRHVELYKKGQVTVINDIHQEPRVTDCYRKMLEQFGVKANLVAPILKNNQLLGLMIAHQCSEPRTWQQSDIKLFVQLANQIGFAVDQVSFLEKQEAETERAQLLTEMTHRIRQSSFLEDLFKTTVKEVRRVIKTDRVIIYGLDSTNWDGSVVAESVAPGWPHTLKVKIDDPCFRDRHVELYKKGQVTVINDIYQEPRVTDCYRKMLEQFGVKANLVAPIMSNNQLLGLMIAHHCSEPRNWQPSDVELFTQLAKQVGFAVEQLSLREQLEEGG